MERSTVQKKEKALETPRAVLQRQKNRFRVKRNFIFCAWTLVFIYFSVVAELKHRAAAKTLPEPFPVEKDFFDSSEEEIIVTTTRATTTTRPLESGPSKGPRNLPWPTSDSDSGKNGGTERPSKPGVTKTGKNGKHKYGDNEIPGVNCTPPGIDDFPSDFFTQDERRQGYVIVHFLVSLYVFYAIAIVCDDYFVSSIECICEAFKMPADVAGATFMAIATSAPELFTNIIGTFITQGDVGVGTIVGSAVFNILAVAAVCGIGAGMVIPLEWYSVTRDCIFYSFSVTLLLFVLKDERIFWYEALVLVLTYILYILAMWQNTRLKKGAEKLVYGIERRMNKGKVETTYNMKETGDSAVDGDADKKFKDEELIENAIKNLQEEAEVENEESNLCKPPSGQGCRACTEWILSWPIRLLYKVTIPDCRKPERKRWYPMTFGMCVAWIGVLAYLVNWMMTIIGHTLQIPDSIMGLTFIAAGTSVPEAVSSIIVARQGLGSMALSNSIGSNTFDILICLGLPWLIRSSMLAQAKESSYIRINSLGLEYSTMMLITSLIVLYAILAMNKFVLDKRVGFVSLLLYALFLVFASLFELNVFFQVNLKTCVHHLDPDPVL